MKHKLYKNIITFTAICFLGTAFAQKFDKKFTENLERLEEKRKGALKDAEIVEKVGVSKMNTNFGTRKEGTVAEMYHGMTGQKVLKPNIRQVWDIAPGFEVVGKFDGFAEDGTLVEIKNRVRRLFKEVKEYENVQVHVYMKMSHAMTAHLVERYKDEIMIHDVLYDDDFMCEIEAELERVIRDYFSEV